jgi:methionyl-tRNA formyltransferase
LAELGADLAYLGTIRDDIAPYKAGRIYLDDFASRHNTPLHKFRNMNDPDAVERLRAADLDWLYVIGWSQMAKSEVLSIPRRGVVGIHPTLLPVGRGRASIPWAIIKGLKETGVTMFQLDEGVDTGPILGQVRIPVEDDETSTTLYEKVVASHRTLVRQTYPQIADGTIEPIPQDEERATVWPGRKPADGLLDPEVMDAEHVDRHVRALTHPYPGAFVRVDDKQVLRIWKGHIGVGDGRTLTTPTGPYTATRHEDRLRHPVVRARSWIGSASHGHRQGLAGAGARGARPHELPQLSARPRPRRLPHAPSLGRGPRRPPRTPGARRTEP